MTWFQIPTHNTFKLYTNFQNGCWDLWDICRFFKGKIPEKFLPLTSISQKLVISPFQSEISDVPAGCVWMEQIIICYFVNSSWIMYVIFHSVNVSRVVVMSRSGEDTLTLLAIQKVVSTFYSKSWWGHRDIILASSCILALMCILMRSHYCTFSCSYTAVLLSHSH